MTSLPRRSAAGAQSVASGRTVSKAALASRAWMHKADRTRRHGKELPMDAVLGIDIAKAKFDVALQFADGRVRRKSCVNSPAGFAELHQWLTRQRVDRVHACLEATGTYGGAPIPHDGYRHVDRRNHRRSPANSRSLHPASRPPRATRSLNDHSGDRRLDGRRLARGTL